MTKPNELVAEWLRIGPASWAQGPYGWVGEDLQPITLEPWQCAVLNAWFEHREDVTTLGISNTKKTGKTFDNAVLLCWRWLALPGQHFAAGNDLDQSIARQFQEIAAMVRRNPFLSENVKVGKSELEFTLTGSKLTALAADAAGNAGANHLTVSHTEAWGILYEAGVRSWEELTPPPGKSYGLPALRVADSYAGFVGESKTWHKLVDRGLTGERVSDDWPIFKIGGLLLFHMEGQEAQERCFRGTESERIDYYLEQAESLRPNAYSRMHLNQRTAGESAFVTSEQWEACYSLDVHPLQSGEKVRLYLGADASQKHDFTALIGTQNGDTTDVRFVKVWKPAKRIFGASPIDLEETIGAEVLRLHKAGHVAAVCYDPWQLATVARQWEKAGIKCIEMPQTNQRIEADTALYNAIISGRVRHFKSPDLDEAVRNAVILETPRGMRIAKEKSSKKIDALVALSMAHSAAISVPEFSSGTIEDWEEYAAEHEHYNRQPHPLGVTWENCPHRQQGCYACEDEQKEATRAEEALYPISDDPADKFNDVRTTATMQRWKDRELQEIENDEKRSKTLAVFYQSVRNDRDNKRKEGT